MNDLRWLTVFVAMLVCLLSPPTRAQDDGAPTLDVPAIPEPSGDLRVMVWNVQRGSNGFDHGPEKTLAWIRAANPDIVLMQESYDIDGDRARLGPWLAAELGWDHHQGDSTHLCIFSPLVFEQTYFHEAWHGIGARLRDKEGRTLVAYSMWIDYRAYAAYALRDDPAITDEDLLAKETDESDRYDQATDLLDHLREVGHLGDPDAPGGPIPLLVGGDWNCPSHLDWTAETELVFRFRRDLPLPVSTAMQDAGFTDTFREVHPSPLVAPGITWSPLFRGTRDEPGTADRIDRLYALPADPAAAVTAEGEAVPTRLRAIGAMTLPTVYEDEDIEQADRLFPSDHAALIVDLVWE